MRKRCWPARKSSKVEKPSDLWADIVARVDPKQCRGCLDCAPLATCTANAFRREDPDGVPTTDENLCFGCYACVAACPHGAIIMPRKA
jgi:Fe-S-cluster-containing hydrogenase component 2